MSKECLWYDGENSCYHLLDFNPNHLDKEEIKEAVIEELKKKGFDKEDCLRELKTVYLIDIDKLESVGS